MEGAERRERRQENFESRKERSAGFKSEHVVE